MTSEHKRAVGIFNSRSDAESALQDLKDSNYAMDKVSVIAQESAQGEDIAGVEVRENVGNKADEGAVSGAVAGGTIGGITGLLVGLGMLAIPGIGPIMFAGAEATAIATTLAGGAIGAATVGLAGALVGLGIPEERAKVYHDRVSKGSYLVIVNGTEAQINHAQEILSRRGIQEWGIYDIPTSPADETQPKVLGQYKYIVGVFRMRHDLKDAISAMRETHFPMTQIYVVEKNPPPFASINSIEIKERLENYAGLGMSEERARHYEQLLERGNYLIVLSGTDEQINEAKSVLEDQSVEDLSIHDPSVVSVNS
ncbi:general stress protein [Rivularia sp. UHCC 0363]|uniref:general stress protein n=1 Tax=Rivularia sp. UHCC 0363 TaxID=3110244 RepID=UPI002B1F3570|nr:general stress protein [Rivularia sp. UHCC 0363]MEA5597578.1 general stress protein [Rivularia sp. UHCC 0363]